jgi:hypothetical protein
MMGIDMNLLGREIPTNLAMDRKSGTNSQCPKVCWTLWKLPLSVLVPYLYIQSVLPSHIWKKRRIWYDAPRSGRACPPLNQDNESYCRLSVHRQPALEFSSLNNITWQSSSRVSRLKMLKAIVCKSNFLGFITLFSSVEVISEVR